MIEFFRYLYFTQFIPNTLYAKAGFELQQILGGMKYIIDSYKSIFGGFGFILLIPLIISLKHIKTNEIIFISVLIISIFSFSIVLIGGDHFANGRYLMPIIPFIVILIGIGFEIILKLIDVNIVKYIFIFIFLFAFFIKAGTFLLNTNHIVIFHTSKHKLETLEASAKSKINKSISDSRTAMLTFKEMGIALKRFSATNSIATVPIGAIGYFSKLKIYDMVGLTEPQIAKENFDPNYIDSWRPGHDKGNGEFILSKKPTFIQIIDYFTKIPQAEPDQFAMQYKSVAEIWESKDFHMNYQFSPIKLENGWYYNLYKRK